MWREILGAAAGTPEPCRFVRTVDVPELQLSMQVTDCYLVYRAALMTWVQRALAMWSPSAS
jgi:hypothetical protein